MGQVARTTMERYTGIALKSNEVVHHKDEDPFNNNIENLEVMTHNEHTHYHRYGKGKYGIPHVGNEVEYNRIQDKARSKKPERIEALMVIMCLSLLVYNFSQHKLRQALKDQGETLPNQKKKEIQTPTMRWIFQIMEGIGLVEIYDSDKNISQKIVTNLDSVRTKIIRFCGHNVMKIYKVDS